MRRPSTARDPREVEPAPAEPLPGQLPLPFDVPTTPAPAPKRFEVRQGDPIMALALPDVPDLAPGDLVRLADVLKLPAARRGKR